MNIPTAIEILDLNLKEAGGMMPPDTKEALKLGVEAMLAVIKCRSNNYYTPIPPLPGETED